MTNDEVRMEHEMAVLRTINADLLAALEMAVRRLGLKDCTCDVCTKMNDAIKRAKEE